MPISVKGRLKGFEQHGVDWRNEVGDQHVGDCPFCGTERKFYADSIEGLFDCKKCGVSGNWTSFLELVAQRAEPRMRDRSWAKIEEFRGLRREDLEPLKLGLGFWKGEIIIPVSDPQSGRVTDLRRWKPNRPVSSTAGAKTGLLFSERISDKTRRVWICEGEWDAIALYPFLPDGEVAVAVPGFQTFKTQWLPAFRGRDVVLAYDNDGPGEQGTRKATNLLAGTAASIQVVAWPGGFPDKGDVRDFVVERIKAGREEDIYPELSALLDAPQDAPKLSAKAIHSTSSRSAPGDDLEPLDAAGVLAEYSKWLKLPDPDVLSVIFGTIYANRFPGDPSWTFLVADSGGGKSELLMPLRALDETHVVSSLTPSALVSGAVWSGGADPSLLPKLDGKVLVVKDFTVVLKMSPEDRGKVLSILRDVYDGSTSKEFGTGIRREYDVKFSMVAGVTPAIDAYASQDAGLGERFLKFRVPAMSREDMREITRRAIQNVDFEDEMREALRVAASRAVIRTVSEPPSIGPEIEEAIVSLAEFCSRLRGVVLKDKYTKEVLSRPVNESPTRVARQLAKMAKGIAAYHGRSVVGAEELRILKKIALDTVADRVADIVRAIAQHEEPISQPKLAEAVNLPTSTIYNLIDDLAMLGVVSKVAHGKQSRITLGPEVADMYHSANLNGAKNDGTTKRKRKRSTGGPRRVGSSLRAKRTTRG